MARRHGFSCASVDEIGREMPKRSSALESYARPRVIDHVAQRSSPIQNGFLRVIQVGQRILLNFMLARLIT